MRSRRAEGRLAPVKRSTPYPQIRAALERQCTVLIDAFGAADPLAPSAVPGWTVTELERHLSQTLAGLAALADSAPADGPVTGIRAWAEALPGLSDRVAAQVRDGAAVPLAEAADRAYAALDSADPDRPIRQWTGVHRLGEAALFRLIEAVVHGLDLPAPPTPDPVARRIVVRELAGLLVEIAPGRSVELRVPPIAAVQILAGPRHTRGTPPGVVETEPEAFLRLCTGRLLWSDAVAEGVVQASGERTDLSGLLPLLR